MRSNDRRKLSTTRGRAMVKVYQLREGDGGSCLQPITDGEKLSTTGTAGTAPPVPAHRRHTCCAELVRQLASPRATRAAERGFAR